VPRALSVLAGVLVAPWIAWALVRTLGLDRVPLLAKAVAFTPYAALTAPLPFVAALFLRRPRAALAMVPAMALLGLAVVPRALPGPRAPDPGGRALRVMTLNVYAGAADARAVARLVADQRVDVLSLQEVTPEGLAALDAAGLRRSLPRRVDGSAPGARGTAVLSRLPLTEPRRTVDRSGLVLTSATVRTSAGRPVDVHAVHPPPPLDGRSHATWRRLLRALPSAGTGRVRVLAGDFNATLDHRELRLVLERGYQDAADVAGEGLRTTWPAGRRFPPELAIDHVLADRRAAIERVVTRAVPGSDHRAVIADVRPGR
jgi:endonuclease/exonuclease/phosphatase (EEP) superfamily protein YafD